MASKMIAGSVGSVLGGPARASFYRQQLLELKEAAAAAPDVRREIGRVLREADRVCGLPLVTRAASLRELRDPQGRRIGAVDSRVGAVEKADPPKAGLFALAMSDTNTTQWIARELPLLAAAYVLTAKPAYLDRLAAQLRETAAWVPLQRPGWTLYIPENDLPPGGDDGVWLSTGAGLIGLVQAMEIVPPDALPAELRETVRAQIGRETARIAGDWERRVPWYVRAHKVISNQWIVPSSGLVLGTAYLGQDTPTPAHAAAYEQGVAHLLESLQALGTEGASSEGFTYASYWTAPFLYLAARAAADAGDRRLAAHGFLRNFPRWLAQCFQPGDSVVNCFDAPFSQRGGYATMSRSLSLLAALSRDPELVSIVRRQIGAPLRPLDLYGLLTLGIPRDAEREPPLWGAFHRAAWAVWRSGWERGASGAWVRGGDALDFHDHHDRGHVNFIVDGKPILIEAGTPAYGTPDIDAAFRSVRGHNALQVGDELFPALSAAPITVDRLDASGGDVTVDAGAGYARVARWRRRVVWDRRQIDITDHVELKAPERVLFRWHLGSEQPLSLSAHGDTKVEARLPAGTAEFPGWVDGPDSPFPEGLDWVPAAREKVPTPAAEIAVEADRPVDCAEEKDADATFKFGDWHHRHTTLAVRSREAVTELTVRTTVRVP